MKNLILTLALVLVGSQAGQWARGADDKKTEAEFVKQVQDLVQAQKVAEAEEAFEAARKAYPEADAVKGLRSQMYMVNMRAGQYAAGAGHAVAYLDDQLELLAKDPSKSSGLIGAVSMAGSALQLSGKPDLALEKVDSAIAAVEAMVKETSSPQLAGVPDILRLNKINMLLSFGRAAAAAELLQTELAAAAKAHEEMPDDEARAGRLAQLMQFEVTIAVQTAPDSLAAARGKLTEFVTSQLKRHPSSVSLVSAYNSAAMQSINAAMSTKPDEADKQIAEWKTFLDGLDMSSPAMKNVVQNSRRNVGAMEQRLVADRKRFELIGKAALPIDAQDWLNGTALSEGDLMGKVVLLDFWAVWCGPCIATFPHLRDWNEKFGEKGLVIVGMTRYYQYDWDDEAKRSKQAKGLSPELEQAAMLKFAEHHQLKHRFAVMPKGTTFDKDYGVTGIPQAVLIDRQGIVRMIRVGSGDKNAHDLEKMLEELIGESPAASTSAPDKDK
jgi:thiol-disulfide isomerase/thioredoxin